MQRLKPAAGESEEDTQGGEEKGIQAAQNCVELPLTDFDSETEENAAQEAADEEGCRANEETAYRATAEGSKQQQNQAAQTRSSRRHSEGGATPGEEAAYQPRATHSVGCQC